MRVYHSATSACQTIIKQLIITDVRKLNKLIALLLMIQSLFGLYQSVKFVVFEQKQIAHVTEGTLRQILNREVITLISVLISFFFAIQLSLLPRHKSQVLQNILGVGLIIFNAMMMNWLAKLPILERFLVLLGL